jgi:arylsulfatase A-like enzyme
MTRSIAVLLLAAITGCASEGPPNLVLVVVDTLRRDFVGAYGYERPTTPFLDQLADAGVVFDNAYAQSSQTLVSTATLMTSRLFPHLGEARGSAATHLSLLEANSTLAEGLKDAGYQTLGVFTNPHHYPESGFAQGFSDSVYLRPQGGGAKWYADAREVRRAFQEALGRRDAALPLFAYLHFMDPHDPYMPPRALKHDFTTVERPANLASLRIHDLAESASGPEADALTYLKDLYAAEIRFVDNTLKRIVGDLQSAGLWENTVLVVTSDHGEGFMERGVLGHGTSHDKELVAVPLVVHGSGIAGRRVLTLARNLDLVPTLLSLAKAAVPLGVEGKNLSQWLTGPAVDDRTAEPAFGWYREFRSLTTPDWHLTWNRKTGERHLYDNAADPAGLIDVADAQPEALRDLSQRVEAFEQTRREREQESKRLRRVEAGTAAPDAEVEQQLRQLGYL